MTESWTRRQMLRRSGTAAAAFAGLGSLGGLAACGTSSAAKSDSTVELVHYVSRPDLTSPKVTLTYVEPGTELQYLFLGLADSGPGQGGAMIMNTEGHMIWFSPDVVHESKMDFQVQSYHGKPVLTWFQGRVVAGGHGEGVGIVADSSYRTIATIRAHNGLMVDLHDFVVTPQGTALVTAFRTIPNYDLSPVGGPVNGYLLSGVAQEIDIATGKLLFQWDSLDHVPLSETCEKFSGSSKKPNTSKPFDYFHINSIAEFDSEHLMIGARNTWCVYLVKRSTGEIVWRLNGKKSDFTMGPGTRFFWQHDARWHGNGVLTLFDDGSDPPEEKESRALVLDVDTSTMLVTLKRAYTHQGELVLAHAMGNAQLLPDGKMFVGWGTTPYFSEFDAAGKRILEGRLTKGDPTYRSFIGPWTGHPTEVPAVAARHRGAGATVYASWNGATAVRSWSVYAGPSRMAMARVGSAPWSGFETAIPVSSKGPYFAVQANDAAGRSLSRSLAVKIA